MRYREFAPGPALEGLVHRFWTLEGPADATAAEFQRAMPDGRPELVFNLGDPFERRHEGGRLERQALALLVGPTTRAMLVRPTGRVDLVGVRLAPGGWPALLDVAGEALLDRAVALGETSRRWRADLLEPLAEAPTGDGRVAILERRLRRFAGSEPRGDRRPDPRLRRAL
ncbi:MAG TPA: DUF6597 domain-containing transcriptional factor, partial [Gemmatimonadales bacterium]|nr:DUF6597 domain-containing transcriptional factor [Gemmatimonadales bacterium]